MASNNESGRPGTDAPTIQGPAHLPRSPDDPDTTSGLSTVGTLGPVDEEEEEDEGVAPDEPSAPLALQRALREVEASIDARLVAHLETLEALRHKEDELQEKLEQLYLELGSLQDSLAGNAATMRKTLEARRELSQGRFEMQATAVQRTLLTEASELIARNLSWQERLEEAEARVRAFKENPELASQLEEFRKLDERMDTLELLPEGYRDVVRNHHGELKKRLDPYLNPAPPPEHNALRLGVAVSVAADRDEGEGVSGRLLAVLPVEFATHDRARQGKGDLQARFAFRVMAALSRFVVNIGARTDPKPVDLGGLLGIELPFDDLDLPVAPQDLARALRDSFSDARDTQMARVNVSTDMVFVPMQALELLWQRSRPDEDPTPPKSNSGKRRRGRK